MTLRYAHLSPTHLRGAVARLAGFLVIGLVIAAWVSLFALTEPRCYVITRAADGTLITTEQCLLHPNRNPDMTREEIERGLCDFLGVERVVWLGQGLVEDKDTDGHVDLVAAFTRPGEVLLQSTPLGTPSS